MRYVIFEKAQIKPFTRTRRGKVERVKSHVRQLPAYDSGLKEGDRVVDSDGLKGRIIRVDPENEKNFVVLYNHDQDSWSVESKHLRKVKVA